MKPDQPIEPDRRNRPDLRQVFFPAIVRVRWIKGFIPLVERCNIVVAIRKKACRSGPS